MNVNDVALRLVEKKKTIGYADYTVWGQYKDRYYPIIVFFNKHGSGEWSDEMADNYRTYLKERINEGKMHDKRYRALCFGIEELETFVKTEKLIWPYHKKEKKFSLTPYYQKILNEFIESSNFHPNTRDDAVWACNRYFSWLQFGDYKTLIKVDATVIQDYLCVSSMEMKSSSLYNIRLYMKKLYHFLADHGYSDTDYALLFSFRVSRERPQLPAADPDEVRETLSVIDQNTSQGKRDYAMLLLGATLGMRAGDIIRLKLKDIDWANGEIRYCQSKTSKAIVLPLTNDVGIALQQYILGGRPNCDYDEVFIRTKAPLRPYVDSTGIQCLYNEYRRKAGLSRTAFDGKGFHSLRRSVGKRMITSGVPVTTVSQVLGHSNITSAKRYIALDSVHLKECALDFTGIEVKS